MRSFGLGCDVIRYSGDLELIVASAVLATVLMVVMALVASSANLSRTSRERSQAVAAAKARIDALRATLRAQPMTTSAERGAIAHRRDD